MKIEEIYLLADFKSYGMQVFENVFDRQSCEVLSKKQELWVYFKKINDVGIKILTLNGNF